MTRREFLSRLTRFAAVAPVLGLPWLAFFSLGRRSRDPRGGPKPPVLPPGAGSLARFGALCTACARCIHVCPTGVLKPTLLERGLRGLLQPVLDFSAGYCDYRCTACGRVCPTGAIERLSKEEKKSRKVGTVYLVKEDCIVFARGTACGACAEICPTQAIRMVAYRPGLTQPLTDPSACVGCGACEYVCPALPRKALYVAGIDPHTVAVLSKSAPAPGGPSDAGSSPKGPEAPPNEFPF